MPSKGPSCPISPAPAFSISNFSMVKIHFIIRQKLTLPLLKSGDYKCHAFHLAAKRGASGPRPLTHVGVRGVKMAMNDDREWERDNLWGGGGVGWPGKGGTSVNWSTEGRGFGVREDSDCSAKVFIDLVVGTIGVIKG